jgi:hypothetical protein
MALDISCDHMPSESIKLLLAQLPRARGLRLRFFSASAMARVGVSKDGFNAFHSTKEEIAQSLKNLPQSLEHLAIYGVWLDDLDNDTIAPGAIPFLTDNINQNRPPNLHHLYLSRVIIDWKCSLLKNLRTLVLDFIGNQSYLSIDRLLEILEACPEIEKLGISDVSWLKVAIHKPIPEKPMALPHLRYTHLNVSEPSVILEILRQIEFPEEAKVWIGLQNYICDSELLKATMLALLRAGRPLSRLGIACRRFHAGIFGSISGSTGDLYSNPLPSINHAETLIAIHLGGLCFTADGWSGTRSRAARIVKNFFEQDISSLIALEVHSMGLKRLPWNGGMRCLVGHQSSRS